MTKAHLKASEVLYLQLDLLTCINDEVVHAGKEPSVTISSGTESKTRNAAILITIGCPHPVSRSCLPS